DQCKDSEEQGHFQSHAATQESNGPDIAYKDRAGEAKAIPGRQPKKDGYQYELARKDGPIDRKPEYRLRAELNYSKDGTGNQDRRYRIGCNCREPGKWRRKFTGTAAQQRQKRRQGADPEDDPQDMETQRGARDPLRFGSGGVPAQRQRNGNHEQARDRKYL